MFDWNYYKPMCKEFKFFDEFKGQAFSRKNLHNKTHNNKNILWQRFINELPDSTMKDLIKSIYVKEGEAGMVKIHEIIKQICQNPDK